MPISRTERARLDTPADVGTLWTLESRGRRARCALLVWPAGWELRVVVDSKTLIGERCTRVDEAFALAEDWKSRLLEEGWTQVLPGRPSGTCLDPPSL